MVSMMRGVIQGGTASAAQVLGVPLAGKTGTVNDHTDGLVSRLHTDLCHRRLDGLSGEKETARQRNDRSARALPYFIDFMKDFLRKPKEDFPKAPDYA